jgi:hypothetical protein
MGMMLRQVSPTGLLLALLVFVQALDETGVLAAAPLNDNVCDATEVFLNTTVPWDNLNATAEMGEPNPGPGTDVDFGGCLSQDGWCNITEDNEPGVQNSIWYKFTATSDCVTIFINEGTDMQLALWGVSGGDVCPGPANFSNLVEISGNDDGGPAGVSSPIIQSATVTKGQVYYTQLDGFAGALGIGTISFTDCSVRNEEYPYCAQPGAVVFLFLESFSRHQTLSFQSPFSSPKASCQRQYMQCYGSLSQHYGALEQRRCHG